MGAGTVALPSTSAFHMAANPLLVRLPASVPGKAVEDSPSSWEVQQMLPAPWLGLLLSLREGVSGQRTAFPRTALQKQNANWGKQKGRCPYPVRKRPARESPEYKLCIKLHR